ncbi:MAG: helicase, partial [Bacteroidales bacterium]|nr:helicase [Bacteroidales bacterium]
WGIPAYIERSRSGKGAHVWVFFEEPVLAADARRLGFAIIGAAMESNVRLDMKSYDRFLPNQDFLPKGGFGNLIALPLQGLARKNDNSVFVDEGFKAFKDQWSFLSSVRKLTAYEVKTILANHAYQIELSSSSETKPWETPKPDRISFEDFSGPVKLVRANGLYVWGTKRNVC